MTQLEMESAIESIQERNRRVEGDKAWEVSWTRRLSIAVITYLVALVWLVIINESDYWLKAFVPVFGYILSTLSLPIIKRWWLSRSK